MDCESGVSFCTELKLEYSALYAQFLSTPAYQYEMNAMVICEELNTEFAETDCIRNVSNPVLLMYGNFLR